MSTRVYEAIKARWDAQALGTTFTGGVFFGQAPSHAAFPYVVMISLGNFANEWTSHSEIRFQSIQFSIFYQEDNTNDPVSGLGSLMRTLRAAFDFAGISIPASAGHVIEMRPMRDDILLDPEAKGVWMGQVDYDIMRRVPVDYSPA